MPFNGSGGFTPLYNFENDALNGIKILASRQDEQWNDVCVNGLSNCLTRDGQGSAQANLPMNNHIHTGVGNATALNQYAAAGQVQTGLLSFAVAAGTPDAITASYSPAIAGLVNGMQLGFRASAANTTTAPTFSPNGFPAAVIKKLGTQNLSVGDISADQECIVRYNISTGYWELLNPPTSAANTYPPFPLPATGYVFGDSFSEQPNSHTSSGNSLAYIWLTSLGVTPSITAASGMTSFDMQNDIYAFEPSETDLIGYLLGTNNVQKTGAGSDAPDIQTTSLLGQTADVLHLSTPFDSSLRIAASAATQSVGSVWTSLTTLFADNGDAGAIYSENASGDDTLQFTLPACDKFSVTYVAINGSGGTFRVIDNATNLGEFSVSGPSDIPTNGTKNYGQEALIFNRGNFVPRNIQIVVTSNAGSDNVVAISMVIGGTSSPRLGPLVLCSNETQRLQIGWDTAPGSQQNTPVQCHINGAIIPSIATEFGSRVKAWDWASVFDPSTMTDTDGFHPNQIGAETIAAEGVATTLDATTPFEVPVPDVMTQLWLARSSGYPAKPGATLSFDDQFQWAPFVGGSLTVDGNLTVDGILSADRSNVNGDGVAGVISAITDGRTNADGVAYSYYAGNKVDFTASIASDVMTVTAVASGTLAVNQFIYGTGVATGQYIASFGSGSGGTGTYNMSKPQTLGSGSLEASSTIQMAFDDAVWTDSDAGTEDAERSFWCVTAGVMTKLATLSASGWIMHTGGVGFYNTTPPSSQPTRVGQLTDSTGGSVSSTLAAITAGVAYSQADMVAVKNGIASIAAKLNAIETTIHNTGITA